MGSQSMFLWVVTISQRVILANISILEKSFIEKVSVYGKFKFSKEDYLSMLPSRTEGRKQWSATPTVVLLTRLLKNNGNYRLWFHGRPLNNSFLPKIIQEKGRLFLLLSYKCYLSWKFGNVKVIAPTRMKNSVSATTVFPTVLNWSVLNIFILVSLKFYNFSLEVHINFVAIYYSMLLDNDKNVSQ